MNDTPKLMQRRTKLKNVLILVIAFFLPLFATVTTTFGLLIFHFLWLVLLVWSTYFAINQIKHPQLEPWFTDPVKPRNFIFEALIDFLKIELVLVPCLYALLSLIGYEQDERNQASLMQLLMTLSHYTWCYWLITKSVCAYKKQTTTIDKIKDNITK